jgi:hypothetical protein
MVNFQTKSKFFNKLLLRQSMGTTNTVMPTPVESHTSRPDIYDKGGVKKVTDPETQPMQWSNRKI